MKQLSKIIIGFSECPKIKGDQFFYSFQAAERFLRGCGAPDLGYWKTDVTIVWQDEQEYKLRYDMGCDSFTLKGHIDDFIKSLVKHENSLMAAEEYNEFFKDRQLVD